MLNDGTKCPMSGTVMPFNQRIETNGAFKNDLCFRLYKSMYPQTYATLLVETTLKTFAFPLFISFPGGKYGIMFQNALDSAKDE